MLNSTGTIQRSARRAGRPQAAHPRLTVFKVYANETEEAAIRAAASAAHLPIAVYLRQRSLGPVRIPVPQSDLETAAQLARLGHLINQAIALAHRGHAPTWPAKEMVELQCVCSRLAVLLTDPRARAAQEIDGTVSTSNLGGG
jgi:hypothetical protein